MKAGVYRVQVGAMTHHRARSGPRSAGAVDEEEAPPASRPPVERTAIERVGRRAASEPDSIDLHGLTVDDARNRVAGYISRAILAGLERVEIIHGIGTGRLKAAVTKDLQRPQPPSAPSSRIPPIPASRSCISESA